jgi:hypothetical protein
MAAATGRLWLPYGGRPTIVRARNPRAIPHAATTATAHSMMVSTWMTSVSMLSFFSPACRAACCDGTPQRDCFLSFPTVRGFFLRTRCLTPDSTATTIVAVTSARRQVAPVAAFGVVLRRPSIVPDGGTARGRGRAGFTAVSPAVNHHHVASYRPRSLGTEMVDICGGAVAWAARA